MEPVVVVRALHILAAALWSGAVVFMAFVLGPTIKNAGPAVGPFMSAVLRRGGLSWYFLSLGTVTVLAGGHVYGASGIGRDPFGSGYASMITVGAILSVVALLIGFTVLLPNETRMKRLVRTLPAQGPPPPEAMASMQAMGAKQGKGSALAGALILAALVCMALARTMA